MARNSFDALAAMNDKTEAEEYSSATPTTTPQIVKVESKKAKGKISQRGKDIYSQMTPQERENLGRNSDKIHFVILLCADSIPTYRSQGTQKNIPCSEVIGIKLRTDIDIEVPVIPFQKPPKDLKQIPKFETITYRPVKAGSTFALNRMEALYFFMLDKFGLSGYCEYGGDPFGVQLITRASQIVGNGGCFTPSFKFTQSSDSIKVNMEAVDIIQPDGSYALKPEYAESFAALLAPKQGGKGNSSNAAKARAGRLNSCAVEDFLKNGGFTY